MKWTFRVLIAVFLIPISVESKELPKQNLYDLTIRVISELADVQEMTVVQADISMTELKYSQALKTCQSADQLSTQIKTELARWRNLPELLPGGQHKADYQSKFDLVQKKAETSTKNVRQCEAEANSQRHNNSTAPIQQR